MDNNDKNKPVILQEDIFENAYAEFQQDAAAKRLQEKYEVKPYYKRFKSLRNAVLGGSYMFNIISGVAACSLAYFFMKSISSSLGDTLSTLIALIVTLVAIGLLEYVKRFVNGTMIKDGFQFKKFRFGFAAMALLISGISITSSFYGGKKAIIELTPDPTLVQRDSMEGNLKSQIAILDSRITKAENTTWLGVTTRDGSKARTEFQKEKLMLSERLIQVQKSEEQENGMILLEHKSEVQLSAWSFAWVVAGCEILFLMCIFYIEFYDYRSITEFAVMGVAEKIQNVEVVEYNVEATEEAQIATEAETRTLGNVAHNDLDNVSQRPLKSVATSVGDLSQILLLEDVGVLEQALSNAKSNRSAFKSKLKNKVGKYETNQSGFDKWNDRVVGIENRIQEIG